MYEHNDLPVIDSIHDMSEQDITHLLKMGIGYLKVNEDGVLKQELKELRKAATSFFELPTAEKEMVPGYDNRHKRQPPEFDERISFSINHLSSAFMAKAGTLQTINEQLHREIVQALLEKIFIHVDKKEFIENLVDVAGTYFSAISYPANPNPNATVPGFIKHKDWGMMTVLSLKDEGLKIRVTQDGEKSWVNVPPRKGYFVIVLANVLQLMLGKDKCNAVSHKVDLTSKERMTLGFFFSPPVQAPIFNVFTNEKIYNSFIPDYVEAQQKKYK